MKQYSHNYTMVSEAESLLYRATRLLANDCPDAAVANLANTPNRRYWEKSDIDVVNDWLDSVPDGERSDAVAELERRAWEEYHIDKKEWLSDVVRRIEDGDLGVAQGRGW